MQLQEFRTLIQENEFGYNMGGYLENTLNSYINIIEMIAKIESLEKYVRKGDIFDATFYTMQLNRDILKILRHIGDQVDERIRAIDSYELSIFPSGDISLQENSRIQIVRINGIKKELEAVRINIYTLTNRLEQNTTAYY